MFIEIPIDHFLQKKVDPDHFQAVADHEKSGIYKTLKIGLLLSIVFKLVFFD